MSFSLIGIAELVAVAGSLSALGYNLLCLGSAWQFLREGRKQVPGSAPLPPVTILKPLKGRDPGMYECLRSHCLQNYPQYEIVFGVNDDTDPAIAEVRRLRTEFPERSIRTVMCARGMGSNAKVSNLMQMLPGALFQNLVINDSDIQVGPDYLARVIAPLADTKVGLVTTLYRGVAANALGSRLEALSIATDFCPGVLAARTLEGIHFGLGSTLALRRCDLHTIGGFEGLSDYLADDYEIGRRISHAGFKVELAHEVVATHLPEYSFTEFLQHQLRWGRTIRDARRWGYAGMVFTFGLPWAMLTVILARGVTWSWILLWLLLIARIAVAFTVGRKVLSDAAVSKFLVFLPLRDLLAPLIWAASFLGHTIHWRGESYVLKNGKLSRPTT